MLKSSLCGYGDAYILVSGTIQSQTQMPNMQMQIITIKK